MAKKEKKLITIDSRSLTSLAVNQAVVAQFPFLSRVVERKPGCRRCSRAARAAAVDNNRVLESLAKMSKEDKRKLKTILGVDVVRVKYMSDRKGISLTFE